jgi:protein CrcB
VRARDTRSTVRSCAAQRRVPLGVLVVNVLGSFLLGLLTGIPHVAAVWLTILGVGVLGGFTTFSTVAVETALLAQRGGATGRG